MRLKQTRSIYLALILSLTLAGSGSLLVAKSKKKAAEAAPSQMDESKRAVHVLNRLAFGPRPGDVEKVTAMGVDKWIEQQLHPDKIDDSALEALLAPFRTLRMDSRQMVEDFPPPQVLKAVADGRLPMPSDPQKRAIYEAGIANYKARQEAKAAANDDAKGNNAAAGNPNDTANNMNADAADMKKANGEE